MLRALRLVFFVALFLSLRTDSWSEPPAPSAGNTNTQPQPNTGQYKASPAHDIPTPQISPPVIENLKSLVVPNPATNEQKERSWYSSSEWWLVYLTGALAAITGALAWYTGRLYRATVKLGEDAEKSGLEQGKRMEASIEQAVRAAVAMEDVAKSMKINADQVVASVGINKEISKQQRIFGQTQMRPYISVLIGSARYQDSALRFEASPIIINNGHTPAHYLKYRVRAAILPVPIPDDFKFTLPKFSEGSNVLGPQQNGTLEAVVSDRVDLDLVSEIKLGVKMSLYVWGYIRYQDVFGTVYRCTFAQQLCWVQSGSMTQN